MVRLLILMHALAGLACLSGCLEFQQTIELNEDGSGRVVEVVLLSDRLVQAAKASPQLAAVNDLLSQEKAKARAGEYGQATFVSHRVEDLGAKGQQATTVYAFKSIDQLTLPAFPNRATNWTEQKMTFHLGEPVVVHEAWRNAYYTRRPLQVTFMPKGQDVGGGGDPTPPAEKEKLQALLPVMRSMLDGFRISLKLEAFGPVEGRSRTHVFYKVKDQDLEDDDTLMKVMQWNRHPDAHLAATGRDSSQGRLGASGKVLNRDDTVFISLPYTGPTDALPPTTAPSDSRDTRPLARPTRPPRVRTP